MYYNKMNFIKPWWVISIFTGIRSSHGRCSIKKGVNKNFAIFTGKLLCWNLFVGVHVMQAQKPFKFIKLQHKCFPVNIAKFLRTAFLKFPFARPFNICHKFKNISQSLSFEFHPYRLPNSINLITTYKKVIFYSMKFICQFKPVVPNVTFLFHLKTCFQGVYRSVTLGRNG